MRKFVISFLFLLGCLVWTAGSLHAEVDLYSFPKIEDPKMPLPEPKKPAEPFVQALAKRVKVPERILSDAVDKGFGRNELIRLVLISKKSGHNLDELLREREKGARWTKLVPSSSTVVPINHKEIRLEAVSIRKEVEAEEKKIKEQREQSKKTTAGVENATQAPGGSREKNHETPQ